MKEPPKAGRLNRNLEDKESSQSCLSPNRFCQPRQTNHLNPELGRRLEIYFQAMKIWRRAPSTTPPQPRFFGFRMSDMSPAGLERWRRGDG